MLHPTTLFLEGRGGWRSEGIGREMSRAISLLLSAVVLAGCAVSSQSGTPADQTGAPIQEASVEVSEQVDCQWPHPPKEADPPIGDVPPVGERLERDDMRLRPGFLGSLLVPESWVVEHDGQCTETPSIAWVNPLDERERVTHRMGMTRTDDRTPRHDPTSDIQAFLNLQDTSDTGGQTVEVAQGFLCNYDFEVVTTDGYTLAGRWLDLGDTYAISSMTVGTDTDMVEKQRDRLQEAVGWERDIPYINGVEFSGSRLCQAFTQFVSGSHAPNGAIMDYRPDGPNPWNAEFDNTCLRYLSDEYPERVRFDDGLWKYAVDDIKDPFTYRQFYLSAGSLFASTHAEVINVVYADFVPETQGEPVLEVAVGVVCKGQAGNHADIQVLRSTDSGWERIGLPIVGYLDGISATSNQEATESSPPSGGERLHTVRPLFLDADGEYVDGERLCCVTGRYANTFEWRDAQWTPVEISNSPEHKPDVRETLAFESLLQVNPTLEDCHYSDSGHWVPGPFREDNGDNIRMSCDFRPPGQLTTFEIEIQYPLRVAAGEPDPVDDHVRAAVKKHLDMRLAEDLESSYYHGPANTTLPSTLDIDGKVVYQSDDLYSVAIDIYHYWSGAANGDPAFEGITAFKPTGELLLLADLFDPSTNWLPSLLEIYDETGALAYPRCGRWATDESSPETAFLGFVITPTALRLYNYLSPNACGLEGVDIGYEQLAGLLDPTGPLAEFVGTEGE